MLSLHTAPFLAALLGGTLSVPEANRGIAAINLPDFVCESLTALQPPLESLLGYPESDRPVASLQPAPDTKPRYPWRTNIVATVFWVGERASGNNLMPNIGSSWDPNWMSSYGGYDDPDPSRRAAGNRPAGFVPKLNPFYVALPYNDCWDSTATKAEAARVIPWFKNAFKKCGRSVCRDRWIAIRRGSRICYAQWSDCGPFATDDANYVFGEAPPANTSNGGAGLDLSPAVRDQLGFKSGGRCDWRFVEADEVPDGPWKCFGANNPFAKDWREEADVPLAVNPASGAGKRAMKSGSAGGTTVVRGSVKRPGLILRTASR